MNNVSKIKDIIAFTIKENIKKKSFIVTTLLVGLVFIAIFPLFAKFTLDDKKKSNIDTIIIVAEDGLEKLDYKSAIKDKKKYRDIKVEIISGDNEEYKNLIKKYGKKETINYVVGNIIYEDRFIINMTIPKLSKAKETEVSDIASLLEKIIEQEKYKRASDSEKDLKEFNKEYIVNVNVLGKGKESEIFTLVKTYFPLIFALIMYFILITYGQSTTTSMTTEKNSKIIELLVAHTRPKKLIMGKVIGIVTVGIGQIIVWIISIIIGILCGNLVANSLANKDLINIAGFIKMIRESNIGSAFSASAIILCVILLILGFMFYLVFAAICGSFINKPEEASSLLAIYTYTIVIGFFIPYMGVFTENSVCMNISKYVPICIPFIAPMDILIGNISVMEALMDIAIMLICTILLIIILGNVYERLVFNKLTLKELISK